MNELAALHQNMGARLAADGIPLHFGNQPSAYQAALHSAILLDRSHEGRVLLQGDSLFDLVNRMSTNKLLDMSRYEGRATVFTTANARIMFRAMSYNLPDGLLMISEPGQGPALAQHLRRNIFFGDKAAVQDLSSKTAQFALHGPKAEAIIAQVGGEMPPPAHYHANAIALGKSPATAARRKSIVGSHWVLICNIEDAPALYQRTLNLGRAFDLLPAGSLTYNLLRIRHGRAAGLELSADYIPLEVGLWDEVSFDKGCYTGQEIIARMESRQRLAKVMVKLKLSQLVEAPAAVFADGKACGRLTSSAAAPDGEIFALAVVKTAQARPGTALEVGGARASARVSGYAGVQPAFITERKSD